MLGRIDRGIVEQSSTKNSNHTASKSGWTEKIKLLQDVALEARNSASYSSRGLFFIACFSKEYQEDIRQRS